MKSETLYLSLFVKEKWEIQYKLGSHSNTNICESSLSFHRKWVEILAQEGIQRKRNNKGGVFECVKARIKQLLMEMQTANHCREHYIWSIMKWYIVSRFASFSLCWLCCSSLSSIPIGSSYTIVHICLYISKLGFQNFHRIW